MRRVGAGGRHKTGTWATQITLDNGTEVVPMSGTPGIRVFRSFHLLEMLLKRLLLWSVMLSTTSIDICFVVRSTKLFVSSRNESGYNCQSNSFSYSLEESEGFLESSV